MRTVLAMALCSLACNSLILRAEEAASRFEGVMARAENLYQDARYAEAYQLCRNAMGTSADGQPRARGLRLLAMICYRSGRFKEALDYGERYLTAVQGADFEGIAAIRAQRQEVTVMLAEVYSKLGKPGDAQRRFEDALRIPDGQQLQEPAWEATVLLRQARAVADAGGGDRKDLLREAERRARRVLEQIDQGQVAAEQRSAATDVVVQACLMLGRRQHAVAALESLLATDPEPQARVAAWIALADILLQAENPAADPARAVRLLEQARGVQRQADQDALKRDPRAREKESELFSLLADAQERAAGVSTDNAEALLKQSVKSFQRAAKYYETLRSDGTAGDRQSFDALSNLQSLQDVYRRLQSWDKAAEVATELLALRRQTLLENDPSILREQIALGSFLAKSGKISQARQQLEAALIVWNKSPVRKPREGGDIQQNLAEVAREEGRFAEAQQRFESVLEVFTALHDKVRTVECHINLANVLVAKGSYESAIKEYDAAERASRKETDAFRLLRSAALLGRAVVHKAQLSADSLDAAISDCQQAWKIFLSTSVAVRGDEVPYLTTLAMLHLSRYEARGAPVQSDDLPRAAKYAQQALKLAGARHEVPVAALHVLAMQELREAQAHCRPGGDNDFVAADQACADAIGHWQQALQEGERAQLPAVQARSANYLAEANVLRYDVQLRDAKLRDAGLKSSNESRDDLLAEADRNAMIAVEIAGRLEAYPALNYRALVTRAKILHRQAKASQAAPSDQAARDKLEEAIHYLETAVRMVETPRSSALGGDRERAEFFSQFIEAYELLVGWLVEQKDPVSVEKAVAYSQISRNRTFVEQVLVPEDELRKELDQQQPGKSALLDRRRKSADRCEQLRRQVQQATGETSPSGARPEKLAEEIRDLRRAEDEYAELNARIREASRKFSQIVSGLSEEDWRAARKQLVGPNDVMLVYHLGPSSSELYVVTAEHIACKRLSLSKALADELEVEPGLLRSATVSDLVSRYLSRLKSSLHGRGGPKIVTEETLVSKTLSDRQAIRLANLILPTEAREAIERQKPGVVQVVPDGALHRLPFEALLLQESPKVYVLDEESKIPPLAYAPSAMVASALKSREPAAVRWPAALLTLGNPLCDPPRPLECAESESNEWVRRFKSPEQGRVMQLLGADASKRNLLLELDARRGDARRRFNYIHLAAHGELSEGFDSGFSTALVLAGPANPAAHSDLYQDEVYALPLGGCELAVLSACESNVGPPRKLEAGSTLTRAFLSAGARRVISSLWSVDDESTAALMGELARLISEDLKDNQNVPQAHTPDYAKLLQQARRHIRLNAKKEWQDPYHWAPFVLIGPAE